jgi:hypothetical protein
MVATHITGIYNVLADALSRGKHDHLTEWMLHKKVVTRIFQIWNRPWIDLFASDNSRSSTQLYRPGGPGLVSARAYAYPQIAMIPRVLQNLLRTLSAQILLVAPFWLSHAWFRNLMDLLFDWPRLIPDRPNLLKNSGTGMYYLDPSKLKLTVWPLSGSPSLRQAFRQKLLT